MPLHVNTTPEEAKIFSDTINAMPLDDLFLLFTIRFHDKGAHALGEAKEENGRKPTEEGKQALQQVRNWLKWYDSVDPCCR